MVGCLPRMDAKRDRVLMYQGKNYTTFSAVSPLLIRTDHSSYCRQKIFRNSLKDFIHHPPRECEYYSVFIINFKDFYLRIKKLASK